MRSTRLENRVGQFTKLRSLFDDENHAPSSNFGSPLCTQSMIHASRLVNMSSRGKFTFLFLFLSFFFVPFDFAN